MICAQLIGTMGLKTADVHKLTLTGLRERRSSSAARVRCHGVAMSSSPIGTLLRACQSSWPVDVNLGGRYVCRNSTPRAWPDGQPRGVEATSSHFSAATQRRTKHARILPASPNKQTLLCHAYPKGIGLIAAAARFTTCRGCDAAGAACQGVHV